jgi:hypothetical protein
VARLTSRRYGKSVVQTNEGTWYWNPVLEVVDFVPYRRIVARNTLIVGHNTEAGAIKTIAAFLNEESK